MENFIYCNPTKIIFGNDAEQHLGKELLACGATKVLLHYGSDRIKHNGLYATISSQLQKANIPFIELGGVVPNPHLSLVEKGIELCRQEGVDLILAVGGGSPIDSAKAIAAGVPYKGKVWDLYTHKAAVQEALMVATILTIPAAGSEASAASVITNVATGEKFGLVDEHLRPVFSLLNPAHTITLPAYQTACGISDMLAHTMERFFVRVPHTDVTDKLCLAHMRAIIDNARRVLAQPKDYDTRAEVMLAGFVAHNDWLQLGRSRGEWSSHAIEHELSAAFDIAHGAGLAIIFPSWMRQVYREEVSKFALWAKTVWNITEQDDEKAALAGIDALESFFKEIGMPVRLQEAGITVDRSEEMAGKIAARGPLGSFKRLSTADLIAIYRRAR